MTDISASVVEMPVREGRCWTLNQVHLSAAQGGGIGLVPDHPVSISPEETKKVQQIVPGYLLGRWIVKAVARVDEAR